MHKQTVLLAAFFLFFIATTNSATIDWFTQKQSGDGTYYGESRGSGTCSMNNPVPSGYAGLIPIALNHVQFGNSEPCGMCVWVTATGAGSGSSLGVFARPFKGYIADKCPDATCRTGHLDIGKPGDGRWKIEWNAIPCDIRTPVEFKFQGSHQWYIKLQVRNLNVPVRSIQLLNGGRYKSLVRVGDNFFQSAGDITYPLTTPLSVRVISVDGQTISESISGIVNDVIYRGRNQFRNIGSAAPTTRAPTTTRPPTTTTRAPTTTRPPTTTTRAPTTTRPPTPTTRAPTGSVIGSVNVEDDNVWYIQLVFSFGSIGSVTVAYTDSSNRRQTVTLERSSWSAQTFKKNLPSQAVQGRNVEVSVRRTNSPVVYSGTVAYNKGRTVSLRSASAPATTTRAPVTTTRAPATTTRAPVTTTKAPAATSAPLKTFSVSDNGSNEWWIQYQTKGFVATSMRVTYTDANRVNRNVVLSRSSWSRNVWTASLPGKLNVGTTARLIVGLNGGSASGNFVYKSTAVVKGTGSSAAATLTFEADESQDLEASPFELTL